ncbi:hypothetical protein, partial [Dialister sp.]|uniref:hypothetical protein n=1 Tax=Dialister sp. TaxID=1955814 RepID=UPI002E800E63
MTDIADESYNREMAGYNFYARHRPNNPDIPDNSRFKSPRRYKFPLYKQQKFNKLLMIQIAIFATIPVKAARARPRAAFHEDLPGAQKFKADP